MNFSRLTIVESLRLLDAWNTTNPFQQYLFLFRLEDIAPASLGSKPTRINALIAHFIGNPGLKGPAGSNIVLETIEYLLKPRATTYSDFTSTCPGLVHSLLLDGYAIKPDGTLASTLPATLSIATKQSEVEGLLSKYGFRVPEGHLKQALSAHTRGDWAAANSQMRTFTESLFDCFANKLLTPPLPSTSHHRREQLAKLNPPFIDPALNEWDPSGNGFIQGFWKRLHPSGSHPGLSDEDDCTFRLQLVYLVAHRFLKRFDHYP